MMTKYEHVVELNLVTSMDFGNALNKVVVKT